MKIFKRKCKKALEKENEKLKTEIKRLKESNKRYRDLAKDIIEAKEDK